MQRKVSAKIIFVLCVVLGSILAFPWSGACEYKPDHVAVVLTGTGTVGYQSGSALMSVFKDKTGVNFSTVPAAKTMGRSNLLRQGKVDFALNPAGDNVFALRGIEEFSKLGPQSVRTLWDGGPIDQGLATRADSGIKTIADIKGKRVATFPTYPMVHLYMQASLAYANLTWDQVKPTPVSSFAAGQRAVIEGAVDVAPVSGQSAAAYELQASVHGIHWIELPNKTAADKAAWARFQKILPAFYPNTVTTAAGASKDKPVQIWGYSYQLTCYDWTNQDLVYWFVKQMATSYDVYKGVHAYLKKWTVAHCLNSDLWFVPRPEGFIKYFKEVGRWTPAMEKKQQALLAMYPQKMTK